MKYEQFSTMEKFYEGFNIGFSDYMVPMNYSYPAFIDHFFGAEGNSLLSSFLCEDSYVNAILLAGEKIRKGHLYSRCGAICVAPEHRGRGVARRLMSLHHHHAHTIGAEYMTLEVIKGNEKAISFYENLGYRKLREFFHYFIVPISNNPMTRLQIESIESLVEINNSRDRLELWQFDLEALLRRPHQIYSIILPHSKESIACFTISKNTIFNLNIFDKSNSSVVIKELSSHFSHLKKLHLPVISEDQDLMTLIEANGWSKSPLSQFEMQKEII